MGEGKDKARVMQEIPNNWDQTYVYIFRIRLDFDWFVLCDCKIEEGRDEK